MSKQYFDALIYFSSNGESTHTSLSYVVSEIIDAVHELTLQDCLVTYCALRRTWPFHCNTFNIAQTFGREKDSRWTPHNRLVN